MQWVGTLVAARRDILHVYILSWRKSSTTIHHFNPLSSLFLRLFFLTLTSTSPGLPSGCQILQPRLLP